MIKILVAEDEEPISNLIRINGYELMEYAKGLEIPVNAPWMARKLRI